MFDFREVIASEEGQNLVCNRFDQDGYARLERVLSSEQVEQFQELVQEVHSFEQGRVESGEREKDVDYQTYKFSGAHYYNLNRRYREFDSLIAHPEVVSLIEKIVGVPVILSQTELRNPAVSAEDNAYLFHTDGRVPMDQHMWVIAFWVLNDIDENNGPTIVIPGTHKKSTQLEEGEIEKAEKTVLTAKAGDVVLMNSNLLHRASVKNEDRPRWLFIPTYNPWFVKPSMDYTKSFSRKTFDGFNDLEKQVYGFTSIVPSDETKRVYTLRPWQEIVSEVQFLEEKL